MTAAAPSVDLPLQDPGGEAQAIERDRDLMKWLIAIFAGIAGLLLTGTQLSGLGALAPSEEPVRFATAVVGVVAGLTAAFVVIGQSLRVLRPVDMSLAILLQDAALQAELESRRGALPYGVARVTQVASEFQEALDDPLLSPEEKQAHRDAIAPVLARAAYLRAQKAFDRAWAVIGAASVAGAVAIVAFVYAANPGSKPHNDASPVVPPKPIAVRVSFTKAGRDALGQVLGPSCVRRGAAGWAIGGTIGSPHVLVVPPRPCGAIQMVLSPALGVATAASGSP